MDQAPYPLEWPLGHARTPGYSRKAWPRKEWTIAQARRRLEEELRRMGATGWVISSDMATNLDGTLRSNARPPADPGVALYVKRKIREPQTGLRTVRLFAMSCDRYDTIAGNLRALTHTIDAMRSIERHGSSRLMEQAMSGFKMLTAAPDVQPPWHEVLGCDEDEDLHEVESVYRQLILENNPDNGGSEEVARRLHNAVAEAREILQ